MKRLACPAQNALIGAIAIALVLAWFYWGKFDGEITGFFRIGSVLPLSPYLDAAKSKIYSGELGYDGQQFLTLAFDPALSNPESIAALDSPVYRYRRILYPLLGYLGGGGQPALIPYVLVAINAIASVLLVWLVSRYLQAQNQARLGLLVLAIPGIWIVLALSTADVLSSVWVVLALTAYREKRRWGVAIALALAGLTRETTLVVWLALLLASWRDRRWSQVPLLFAALLPIVGWNGAVILRFGDRGTYGAASNFGLPLVGPVQKFVALLSNPSAKSGFEAYAFLVLLAAWGAIALAVWRWPRSRDVVAIAALLYGLPLACSSLIILGYYLDYLRVYLDIFGLLLLSATPRWLKLAPLAAAALPSLAFLLVHS
ncbi:MAG: DUF2029 domain-containing protein [Spirulinaceae cyanobacterium RM2_2_10]|nr:DUF2029 domain-containing protein [Spirulinaceae cyanobacterium SM2_1_0]NJO21133.1 DUF2029 domain-containing protein [Spirulinaceae cyanobacterium RM2_2_10]